MEKSDDLLGDVRLGLMLLAYRDMLRMSTPEVLLRLSITSVMRTTGEAVLVVLAWTPVTSMAMMHRTAEMPRRT